MKRSSIFASAALFALSSTVATAMAIRAMDYAVTITGKDGAAVHGSGTVKVDKTTEVEIKLMGDVAGSVRPWHIHSGTCATGGGVFGGGRSYTPITIDAKGEGTGKASLTAVLPDTGSFYVNIHESSGNMAKIVACGDLKHKM